MTNRGAGWWDYAGCGLLTVVPVVSHMKYHGFDFFSIDAVGLIAPYLAVGLAAGWLVQRIPQWARIAVLALLTVVFADLQFAPESIMAFRVLIGAALILTGLLREHYTKIATVSVATILVVNAVRPSALAVQKWEAPARRGDTLASSLVPIVHLVLDEHAAPRSFPADIPEAVQARDRVLSFYQRHGFRLFEKAYSRYFFTHSSIPAMFSPLTADEVRTKVRETKDSRHFMVTENALFRWASGRGYRIHVLQPLYMDTCSLQGKMIASCRTYPGNTLASLRYLPINPARRILLEHLYFLSIESHLAKKVQKRLRSVPVEDARAGMALLELDRLRKLVRENLRGSLLYTHVLLPHYPYELDANCHGRALDERLTPGRKGWGNAPEAWRLRWKLYAGQIECLYSRLDTLIATIESAAPPQGVTIVIHGDHGSRIVRSPPLPASAGDLVDDDFLGGFATLLAARGPGIQPGIDGSAVAIQDIVTRIIMRDSVLSPAPVDPVPIVFLQKYGSWGDTLRRVLVPSLAQ